MPAAASFWLGTSAANQINWSPTGAQARRAKFKSAGKSGQDFSENLHFLPRRAETLRFFFMGRLAHMGAAGRTSFITNGTL